MASNFVPQASFMVRGTPARCSAKNLAFSTAVSRRNSVVGLVSRISTRSDGLCFSGRERGKKCSFVVNAEAKAEVEVEVEAEVVDISENVESVETEETQADDKPPRQPRVKLGDIMGILNKRAIEASDQERPIPDLRVGDIVEIKLEVPENRKRVSIYKGIIISKQNAGIHTTIRIRRIIAGVGVETVFPIYSPNIKEIKVVNHRKVRRAKLYYLRDKLPRLSTFK
ncbi:50S ribosomal protein L19-1, chloroplastic-like [Andrographis paniculata]|uniref:50S ribosomal protein L19-1, chloroplastic-like n=1 Tax=Andrographis paniculata TaxID=175694 RepID=UPI0021E7A102|nr:50S ribosomal protein L19-1, chloroplastic-like [Andrographis paniculata]